MRSANLLAPRAYVGGKFCRNCTRRRLLHVEVACSECGEKHLACTLGVNVTGFSQCADHRSGK